MIYKVITQATPAAAAAADDAADDASKFHRSAVEYIVPEGCILVISGGSKQGTGAMGTRWSRTLQDTLAGAARLQCLPAC